MGQLGLYMTTGLRKGLYVTTGLREGLYVATGLRKGPYMTTGLRKGYKKGLSLHLSHIRKQCAGIQFNFIYIASSPKQ